METRPLNDGFGIEVSGIDLNATEDATIPGLRRLFHENQLMVIRDQDITPERFRWFARHFGRPQPHIVAHLRHAEVPEILPLSNIFVDGKPIGIFDGAAFWHQDMAYEDVPSNATIVHALEVPDMGGETMFADMWGAYDALDAAMKARLDGLVARHRYGNRADEDYRTRTKAMELTEEEQKAMLEQLAAQQAAMQQPATAPEEAPEPLTEGFDESDPSTWGDPGRNEQCPCGSGKKFKHCHGRYT